MKLSVIIPAYNCEKYIQKCLEIIIGEIDDFAEVIVVDDGSKDNTLAICRQYESKNVHIIHQENQGVSMARNKGIEHSSGDYVMFVDADDSLVTGWYSLVKKYCTDQYDIVYFGSDYNDLGLLHNEVILNIFCVPNKKRTNYLASVWSKLFKRQIIIDHHITFDQGLINGEDLLFSLEVFLCSSKYKFVKSGIYHYFVNYESATHVFKDTFVTSNELFLKKAQTIFTKYNVDTHIVETCLKYSFITGVILLLIRISYIEDEQKQNKKLSLFNLPYIVHGLHRYQIGFNEYGFQTQILYWLISHRMYAIALYILNLKFKKSSNKTNKFIQI